MEHVPPFELAETRRLAALHALSLLDSEPKRAFDAIARLAGAATGCPTALISLVDRDRMWVKARLGDAPGELPRRVALCDTVVRDDAPLVVEDLRRDPRFRDGPVVADGARFYAGVPVRVDDRDGARHPIGTLCVLDTEPRTLSDDARAALDDLAALTETLIASRGAASEAVTLAIARDQQACILERQQRLFDQAERMAKIGWWRLSLDDDRIQWSDGVHRIHEVEKGIAPSLDAGLEYYPPHARTLVTESLAHTLDTGEPFDFEADFVSALGTQRRIRATGEVEWSDGRPAAVIGVIRDMTEEHALAEALRRSADTDHLTGIANRAAFNRRLKAAMAKAREDECPLALALIDLDGFKRLNDTFGHNAGDDVLRTIAARLHAPWLARCTAARLGGDEFALIVDDPALVARSETLTTRLEDELRVSTTVDGMTMETGASVGIAAFDADAHGTRRDFVHAADAILYAAKRRRVGERRATA